MKTVDQLCEEVLKEELMMAITKYTMQAASTCMRYTEDPEEASMMLGVLTWAAIIADGRLSEEEFRLLYPGLKIAKGNDATIEECRALAMQLFDEGENYQAIATYFAEEYLSQWKADEKENVIKCCIAICAIDGNISVKEKQWLRDLLKAAK